jgi:30S ribosomal protein S31
MGKGDKKTAKGKRVMGSYGKTRPKKKDAPVVIVAKTEKPAKEKKETVKKETVKKPAAKKATAKKED